MENILFILALPITINFTNYFLKYSPKDNIHSATKTIIP